MSLIAGVVLALAGSAELGADPAPEASTKQGPTAQLGFALTAETVVSPGSVCPEDATAPCILGSGGGLAVRFGYRLGGPWYFGGSYEFSRHDSSNLLRLAILQQLRAEGRYYFDRGDRATGFLAAGAGVHVYGSDWAASTGGGMATAGGGVELELSANAIVGCAVMYRLLVPRAFTDGAGEQRGDGLLGFGLAHMVGLEFALEVRDPVPHW